MFGGPEGLKGLWHCYFIYMWCFNISGNWGPPHCSLSPSSKEQEWCENTTKKDSGWEKGREITHQLLTLVKQT